MGLFSGILGNASNTSSESVERDLEKIMLDDEKVEHAYKLIRDHNRIYKSSSYISR